MHHSTLGFPHVFCCLSAVLLAPASHHHFCNPHSSTNSFPPAVHSSRPRGPPSSSLFMSYCCCAAFSIPSPASPSLFSATSQPVCWPLLPTPPCTSSLSCPRVPHCLLFSPSHHSNIYSYIYIFISVCVSVFVCWVYRPWVNAEFKPSWRDTGSSSLASTQGHEADWWDKLQLLPLGDSHNLWKSCTRYCAWKGCVITYI